MEKTKKAKPRPVQGQKKPRRLATTLKTPLEEKERLAELLRISEEKFRRLFETAQEGILLLDAGTGVITEANPFIEKILRYTRAEMVGKKLWEVGPFRDISASRDAFRELQKKKFVRHENLPLETKDGQLCHVEFVSNVYQVGGQKVIQCNIRDNTKRVQAEALLESEKHHRELFENAGLAIFQVTRAGKPLAVNPEFLRMFGYVSSEEFMAMVKNTARLFANPRRRAEILRLKTENPNLTTFESVYCRKDGSTFHGQMTMRVLESADGKTQYLEGLIEDISARKQVEEALQKSEELFRTAFHTSPDSININRLEDGLYMDINEGFTTLTGYTREDAIGKTSLELNIWNDPADRIRLVKGLRESGQVNNLEAKFRMKDGRLVTGLMSAKTIMLNGIPHILSTKRDIEEMRRAEEALLRTKSYWQALVENTSDLVTIIDTRGVIVYQNQAVKRILGFKPEEFVGKNASEFVQAEDLSHGWEVFGTSVATPRSAYPVIEMRARHKDGTWRTMETTGEVRADDTGQLVAVLTSRDITERKQADVERQTLLEIMQGLVLTEDMQEYLRFLHQAIAKVIFAENFFIILKNKNTGLFEEIYSVDKYDAPSLPSLLNKSISSFVFRSGEPLLLTREDFDKLEARGEVELVGTNFHSWLGAPLKTSKETIGVMAVQDYEREDRYSEGEKDFLASIAGQVAEIVERKRAEEEIHKLNTELEQRVEERTRELREAQEKLIRQEKLAVLGQLAGGVGHELRNPLGIINNAIYYLRLVQPDAQKEVKEYLGIIECEIRTADKIITDLLDFSRIKSIDRETVHAVELIEQSLMRFPTPENVTVTLKLPEDLPALQIDPHHLTQVLGNLIVNACQAMPKGGKLTLSAARKGKEIAITVQDTGVGIPPENMGKLFEPLFTTKLKGIGLGLAVSQKLAEANGGRIEVQSRPGRGSIFIVFLPVSKENG